MTRRPAVRSERSGAVTTRETVGPSPRSSLE